MKTVTTNHTKDDTANALYDAIESVKAKIKQRIAQKGAGLFVDPHQIYGIVAEEVKETMDALHENDLYDMQKELKDIAVAAIWGIASIEALLEKEDVSA